MTIYLSEEMDVQYNPGGYGDFNFSLVEGANDVDPGLAAYVVATYPGIASVTAPVTASAAEQPDAPELTVDPDAPVADGKTDVPDDTETVDTATDPTA